MYITGIAVAGSGQPYTLLYAMLPSLTFALILLFASIPTSSPHYKFRAWFFFILAGVFLLCSWHMLSDVRRIIAGEIPNHSSGAAFARASLSMWLGGISFGLGVLFAGFDRITRKHKPDNITGQALKESLAISSDKIKLSDLSSCSDVELWNLVHKGLGRNHALRLNALGKKLQQDIITNDEYIEFIELSDQRDRYLLFRREALAILKSRSFLK